MWSGISPASRSAHTSAKWTRPASSGRNPGRDVRAGLDGDRHPRRIRRPGRHVLSVDSRHRGASRSRSFHVVIVDVQNTLFNNAILRWGTEEQKTALPAPRRERRVASTHCRKPVRVRMRSRWPRARGSDEKRWHYRLTGRKLWITNAAEAGIVSAVRQRQSRSRLQRHHGFLIERDTPVSNRQERGQARHPRIIHLRTDSGRLPRAESQRRSAKSARATRSRSRR